MQYECEDIVGNAALFSMVGAGLGEGETYRIALAARRLGEDAQHGVATLRFFGKFFGRAADYYVFEATPREAPAATGEPAGQECFHAWPYVPFCISLRPQRCRVCMAHLPHQSVLWPQNILLCNRWHEKVERAVNVLATRSG